MAVRDKDVVEPTPDDATTAAPKVGTGARVLGPVVVGDGVRIVANAVVLDDVAAGTTVVGAPARPIGERS